MHECKLSQYCLADTPVFVARPQTVDPYTHNLFWPEDRRLTVSIDLSSCDIARSSFGHILPGRRPLYEHGEPAFPL